MMPQQLVLVLLSVRLVLEWVEWEREWVELEWEWAELEQEWAELELQWSCRCGGPSCWCHLLLDLFQSGDCRYLDRRSKCRSPRSIQTRDWTTCQCTTCAQRSACRLL